MDFSAVYFGKTISNLVFEDLEEYFKQPKEEGISIEYKSGTKEPDINKALYPIIRAICGLLNSEGGVVVWGAPKEEKKNGVRYFSGDLSPLQTDLKKDWLMNKCSGSITPLPTGIEVASLTRGNNFLYIFQIKKSNYPPHQYDNRYWARLDGQTVPAPHYLTEALFKKISFPNIEAYLKLKTITVDPTKIYIPFDIFFLNFSPLQNEQKLSFGLVISEGKLAGERYYPARYQMQGRQLVYHDFQEILHFANPTLFSDSVILELSHLRQTYPQKIDMVLSFGGVYSPMKFSIYKLNQVKRISEHGHQILYELQIEEENILAIDRQSQLGVTKEGMLKEILGR